MRPRLPRILPRLPRVVPRASSLLCREDLYPIGAAIALGFFVVAALGQLSDLGNRDGSSVQRRSQAALEAPLMAQQATFTMCGSNLHTCVVDGDTIWLEGQNLRLQSFDTPEPYNDICRGSHEIELARKASARLLQLLNGNDYTVDTFGLDGTGDRTLATLRINGRDVGDILIEEGLARS